MVVLKREKKEEKRKGGWLLKIGQEDFKSVWSLLMMMGDTYSLHGHPRQRDVRVEEEALHPPQDLPRGESQRPRAIRHHEEIYRSVKALLCKSTSFPISIFQRSSHVAYPGGVFHPPRPVTSFSPVDFSPLPSSSLL